MKTRKIIACIVIVILQLAAMCLCGLLLERTVAAISSYLVFVCSSTGITAIALSGHGGKRAAVGAACVFLGLTGIAAVIFCHIFVEPPISGIVGFVTFMVFAGIIAAILVSQRKYFKDDYSRLHDRSKRESALHLIRILRSRGLTGSEIRSIVRERFLFNEETLNELMK